MAIVEEQVQKMGVVCCKYDEEGGFERNPRLRWRCIFFFLAQATATNGDLNLQAHLHTQLQLGFNTQEPNAALSKPPIFSECGSSLASCNARVKNGPIKTASPYSDKTTTIKRPRTAAWQSGCLLKDSTKVPCMWTCGRQKGDVKVMNGPCAELFAAMAFVSYMDLN